MLLRIFFRKRQRVNANRSQMLAAISRFLKVAWIQSQHSFMA